MKRIRKYFYPKITSTFAYLRPTLTDISMDFIDELQKSHGKDVIYMVVNRFSEYAYIVALTHPYRAKDVAKSFMENLFRLDDMPNTVIINRHPIFSRKFW